MCVCVFDLLVSKDLSAHYACKEQHRGAFLRFGRTLAVQRSVGVGVAATPPHTPLITHCSNLGWASPPDATTTPAAANKEDSQVKGDCGSGEWEVTHVCAAVTCTSVCLARTATLQHF